MKLPRGILSAAKRSWKKAQPYAKKAWTKAKPYAKKVAINLGTTQAKQYVAKKLNKDDTKSKMARSVANSVIDKGRAYASSKLS